MFGQIDMFVIPRSVPSEDPSGLTVILDGGKYSRIMKASRVRTKEEIQREYEMTRLEKEQALVSSCI